MFVNISLTPQLEAFIHDKVASGRYTSASEVVREALRVLEEYESIRAARLRQLQQEIEVGRAQIAAGEARELHSSEIEDLRASIKQRDRDPGGE